MIEMDGDIMLEVWEIRYRGLWLGGVAIVLARSEQKAIEMVRNHPKTCNFTDVTTRKVCNISTRSAVVYNNSGDY